MKKNIMMRLSAVLLVAVLLTTCVISGTWAKYVTSDDAEDSARVAKWGVTVELDSFDVFKTSYNGTVVEATAKEDVVAPGTAGTLAGISITGTPEVKVEVKFEATLELSGWVVDAAEYCPLEIKVGDKTYKVGTTVDEVEITDIAKLKEVVEEAIEDYTAEYDANVNLADYAEAPQVSWAWLFEGNEDVKDTALGDAATATINLSVTCTVTQVD